MKPMNVNEVDDFIGFEIFGKSGLFSNMRIDRKTIPEGLYAYDLRDECDGEINELKSYVMINHWGTVILKEPVEGADSGVDVTENDYNYTGDMSLSDFLNDVRQVQQMSG